MAIEIEILITSYALGFSYDGVCDRRRYLLTADLLFQLAR